MRLFLFALLSPLLLAQDYTDQDRYGKTESEVLAMGHSKWAEWFTDSSRAGESTFGMADAERIYCVARTKKNREIIASLPDLEKAHFEKVVTLMANLNKSAVFVGRGFTGGGSLWTILQPGMEATAAQALADVLTSTKAETAKQADVWAAVKVARKTLSANRESMESTRVPSDPSVQAVLNELDTMVNHVSDMIQLVAQRPSAEKGITFWYLTRVVKLTTLEG